MNHPAQLLHEYVLGKIDEEPLRMRVELYRALGGLAATPAEARRLIELADDLDAIERRHDQLVLDFQRSAGADGYGATRGARGA